ncbi:MAG: CHAT domain-containing protein [bacterium]|nr:MAG: CHAT domain-containing protein [bacterium]
MTKDRCSAFKLAFMRDAENKRFSNLATRGICSDACPFDNFITLAPGNGEDGQLTARETLEMKFNADLVVLNACETELSKISGDGVEGLLRSFMISGVPSVLVSLWQVHDKATK